MTSLTWRELLDLSFATRLRVVEGTDFSRLQPLVAAVSIVGVDAGRLVVAREGFPTAARIAWLTPSSDLDALSSFALEPVDDDAKRGVVEELADLVEAMVSTFELRSDPVSRSLVTQARTALRRVGR